MKGSTQKILVAAAVLALNGSLLHAQATRTWVSGVGDDFNPCSRTAPCKTFAGAISKTAAGGEISVLDPGSFGTLTITKSISVVAEGSEGGVLAVGVNGFTINAPADTVVTLRGLIIEGAGSGLNGIRFLAGGTLHVQKCLIRGFNASSAGNGHGITFQPTGASELYVSDTIIEKNGFTAVGGGILIKPSGSGSANVVLNRVQVNDNVFGLRADGTGSTGGIKVTMRDSSSAGNTFSGITAITPGGGATVNVMVESTTSVNNGTTGILADGAAATVRISNATITGNATGLQILNSGVIATHANNQIDGNGANGAPNQFPGQD